MKMNKTALYSLECLISEGCFQYFHVKLPEENPKKNQLQLLMMEGAYRNHPETIVYKSQILNRSTKQ